MLYTAYVAVCLAATPVQDCNKDTALNWMVAPGTYDLSYCMIHGQQFAAASGVVKDSDVVKVYCRALSQKRASREQ